MSKGKIQDSAKKFLALAYSLRLQSREIDMSVEQKLPQIHLGKFTKKANK